MNRIQALQVERNLQARAAWEHFASHRDRVTRLVCKTAVCGLPRLCVLGAGNCNDLDLAVLTRHFAEVHLADIDRDALERGSQAQPCATPPTLHEMDASGIAERLACWTPDAPPSGEELETCLHEARSFTAPLPQGHFDVVASTCLLSQLIEAIVLGLGESHPRFLELVTAVRQRHLRLLFDLARPGGTVILVSDLVSSTSCPQLLHTDESQLPLVVADAINAQNFFTGLNPVVVKSLFETDPGVGPLATDVQLIGPWLWNFGPRMYAVYAVLATRR